MGQSGLNKTKRRHLYPRTFNCLWVPVGSFQPLNAMARSIWDRIVFQRTLQVPVINRSSYGPLLDRQHKQEINLFFSFWDTQISGWPLLHITWSLWIDMIVKRPVLLVITMDSWFSLGTSSSIWKAPLPKFPFWLSLVLWNLVPWGIGRSVVCNFSSLYECHGDPCCFSTGKERVWVADVMESPLWTRLLTSRLSWEALISVCCYLRFRPNSLTVIMAMKCLLWARS